MTVKDALGGHHAFPDTYTPVVMPTGVLQVQDEEGKLAAYFAAGGWIAVLDR